MTFPLLRAFDSWGVPPAADVVALGYQAQVMYVPYVGSGDKGPTLANLQDFTDNGLYYTWVYELNPDSPWYGAPDADRDFENAQATFQDVLGIPFPAVCYFPMDDVVPGWAQADVVAYFARIAELAAGIGVEGGCYGSDTICEWCQGVINRFWQTGAGSTSLLTWVDMYQGAPDDRYGYPQFYGFGETCNDDPVWSTSAGFSNLKGPWPPVQPQEYNMNCYDPVSGGFWTVDSDGAVFSYNGAPYLGGLNIHPELQAGGKLSNGPVTGICYYGLPKDALADQGYVIVTTDAKGVQHPYRFPRNGTMTKPGVAK